MNIVLAEERLGKQLAERSFEKETVLAGRDALECDIAFEKDAYPMVSRRHAELSWNDGKWWINDLGSSYGTFVNEQRIDSPRPLSFGDLLRFGSDGPTVRVIWFEMAETPAPKPSPVVEPVKHRPTESVRTVPPEKPETSPSAFLESDAGETIPLGVQGAWIGREPGCEILIESSPLVSRRHAYIRFENGVHVVSDNNSFNGTFVNDQRLVKAVRISSGDRITLGIGGPGFVYKSSHPGVVVAAEIKTAEPVSTSGTKTMVAKLGKGVSAAPAPYLIATIPFGDKNELSIGRGEHNDIRLDAFQVSNSHAKLVRSGTDIAIIDLHSTNGVFVAGESVTRRNVLQGESIGIGPFSLRLDAAGSIGVFDLRSQTRIDVTDLAGGAGQLRLIDGVSLSIGPNEMVGIIGPSGSGKSTLIELLNGLQRPTNGHIFINGHDLNQNLRALRQSIGYVPQRDIVHSELSPERILTYVAKLRLPRDVSSRESAGTVDEVLTITGLQDKRKVRVTNLSGGQKKRVSVAVELITRPSVIYLDEPTSGLDPSTADRMMELFRELADSGRIVVMSTHAAENVELFDKIAVLSAGRLIYFGPPAEALTHFGVKGHKALFDRIGSSDEAESMRQRYSASPQYRQYVANPIREVTKAARASRPRNARLGIFGSLRQFFILSRRYFEVFRKDRLNLLILFAQAPIIAVLTFLAVGSKQPRDLVYFVLALVSIWFGTSLSAREIVRERPVYKRERMFNLGVLPYLASKIFVLVLIVTIQCLLLFLPLKLLALVGWLSLPGEYAGVPHLWTMLLTAAVGVALGLFISAVVRTNELATTLVPLVLIPQILFSGLMGVPVGIGKLVSLSMPAAWSFDTMKRFSTLDTLEPEGADPNGKTKGIGLYKFVSTENDKLAAEARQSIDEYKRSGNFYGGDGTGVPDLDRIEKIPDDLSGYVTFLHPWMGDVVNQLALMLMFGILTILSLVAVRLRDVR